MIALILGGAPSVWRELAEAQALLNRRHMVVAANLAGIQHAGRLDAWATLHPDQLPAWTRGRAGNGDFRPFTPDDTPERWPGSSGLYAAQVALLEMGAAGAILCGIPMDRGAGHFTGREHWEGVTDYRQAFVMALPEIGGRVRSMGGWTADIFGTPTAAWVGAIDTIKPAGVSAQARTPMHHVKNTSGANQKFWARTDAGDLKLVRLGPGEAGDFDIDTAQPRFAKGGAYSITPARDPGAAKPARKAAAKPKTPAKKPAPPAPPVEG